MSLSDAMDKLVERIETYVPTNDPQIRFKHSTIGSKLNIRSRSFRFPPDIGIEPHGVTGLDPFTATVKVEVDYRDVTEQFALLQSVADDHAELFARISYTPGNEWSKANGYDFWITSSSISESGDQILLTMEVKIIYN